MAGVVEREWLAAGGGSQQMMLVIDPPGATSVFAFAHGAGAGMRHPFMAALARCLADHGVATLRYEFPYMHSGSRRPDPQPVLLETVRHAVGAAREMAAGRPLVAGGKSMGGRMTTLAAAARAIEGVRGIALVGFPLHAAGTAPSTVRAQHLARVEVPMLFLQGTRDTLADLDLMRGVCESLGLRATLHVVDGADHGFHVLKRSGRSDEQVLDELGRTLRAWVDSLP